MSNTTCDVAIIGGGHHGLTTAAYLTRAGLSVIVLAKNAVIGGTAITEEFAPGFFSARPVLGYGNYRMPVKGLYLRGSGAHPGGGVTGVPA